jgi:hypothetical protein
MVKRIRWPRLNLRALGELSSIKSPVLKSPRVLGAVSGALFVLIVLALVIPRIIFKPKPISAAQVAVHVRTIPEGANILINNERAVPRK